MANAITHTESFITIDCSPKTLFSLISNIDNFPIWSSECVDTKWVQKESNKAGSKFIGSNRKGLIKWTTYCHITEFIIDSLFCYQVTPIPLKINTLVFTFMKPQSKWSWSTQALNNDSSQTRVSLKFELYYYTFLGKLFFGDLDSRILEIKNSIDETLLNLKDQVEKS
jgi:ribosome-associated toxin RatA of RatAB toxin-antitoxin module